jgi:hypothetical protein
MRVSSATGSTPISLNIYGGHFLETGDQVSVANVCANANGTRTVTVVDRDTVTLQGTSGACSLGSTGTITATSETGNFAEFLVGDGTGTTPSITTTSVENSAVRAVYSQTVAATSGVAPYAWSVSSGSLPAGLSLNSSTGAITGTPTAEGTSNFTVMVTDGASATDTQALSITVSPAAIRSQKRGSMSVRTAGTYR